MESLNEAKARRARQEVAAINLEKCVNVASINFNPPALECSSLVVVNSPLAHPQVSSLRFQLRVYSRRMCSGSDCDLRFHGERNCRVHCAPSYPLKIITHDALHLHIATSFTRTLHAHRCTS
jgi:hypothetical protein